MTDRDVVTVAYPTHDKLRPGVIIRAFEEDDSAIVALGTSQVYADLDGSACVKPGTAAYRALRLSNTTYFYPKDVVIAARLSALTSRDGRCPPELFLALRQVVNRAVAYYDGKLPEIAA